MPGPYDELVAELDHAAAIFGHRKVITWCLEWVIARQPEYSAQVDMREPERPSIFFCRRSDIDESAGEDRAWAGRPDMGAK